jgi:hypothetical protein
VSNGSNRGDRGNQSFVPTAESRSQVYNHTLANWERSGTPLSGANPSGALSKAIPCSAPHRTGVVGRPNDRNLLFISAPRSVWPIRCALRACPPLPLGKPRLRQASVSMDSESRQRYPGIRLCCWKCTFSSNTSEGLYVCPLPALGTICCHSLVCRSTALSVCYAHFRCIWNLWHPILRLYSLRIS